MTRRTPNKELVTEDLLIVNVDDAAEKDIKSGDYVRLFSKRGQTIMKAKVSDTVKPGVLYTTFHFPETSINYLTGNVGDEYTLTPEYKVVAVNFEKSIYGILAIPGCVADAARSK
jgi:formate dehydrogenase major subunit